MDDQLKAFDALLDKTVRAPRLSGSKVTELKEMSTKLINNDHHIVTSLLKLNTSLPPASSMRISNLYVFDAIARAAKSDVSKGIGRTTSTERGKGTQAGLLDKMEGVVDSIVEGMVDDGKGGVWAEGRDKTRKIIEIWRKSNTFPEECIKQLTARIASATTPAGMSPAVRSPRRSGSKPARSTTPTVPPPLHIIERYGVARAAAAAPAPVASSSSDSPPAPKRAPGQLPPEIMALLGVKGPGKSPEKPPTSNAALDAVLANVRKPAAPTPPPNLDPAQLAALANIAALTSGAAKGAGQSQPPPFSNQAPPPRPNGAGAGYDYNGGRYHERPRSRSPDRRVGDPRGYPPARRDYEPRQTYERRDQLPQTYERRDQPPQHHRDQRGSRDFDREPQRLPPKPEVALPARPPSGPPPGAPAGPPPGPPPAPPRGPPAPVHAARSPPPRDAGWGSAPAVSAGPSAGPGVGPGTGGLASFDMSSFNPALPESWAALGAAWKVTTGREPNQMELMGFLATGQLPDASGMSMGMGGMGMMGMNGMGMGMGMGGMGDMGMGRQ